MLSVIPAPLVSLWCGQLSISVWALPDGSHPQTPDMARHPRQMRGLVKGARAALLEMDAWHDAWRERGRGSCQGLAPPQRRLSSVTTSLLAALSQAMPNIAVPKGCGGKRDRSRLRWRRSCLPGFRTGRNSLGRISILSNALQTNHRSEKRVTVGAWRPSWDRHNARKARRHDTPESITFDPGRSISNHHRQIILRDEVMSPIAPCPQKLRFLPLLPWKW